MLSISIHVNTSPLAGKEGTKINATALKDRIQKEAENDVALKAIFNEKGKTDSSIEVQGRGDLHLGILIEKMRREGYEMGCDSTCSSYEKNSIWSSYGAN